MMQRLLCAFPNQTSSYAIEVENGCLTRQGKALSALQSKIAIVTDTKVESLYGQLLKNSLEKEGLETFLFTFPCGESSKTRKTKEMIEDQMFEKGLGRDICVIALGGGVVTDLAGYLAATYCRGVPIIMIPTTLLAMVDACIGGKAGVNVPSGKNMVGTIYQPKKVVIDPQTLKTLSKKELAMGVVEMIKHGLIANREVFDFLDAHSKEVLSLHPETIEKAICDSCRIKMEIVQEDEKEGGKRRLLNFGHTVGHALEQLSNFSISHGEAVAIGILIESYLSHILGYLNEVDFNRIIRILNKYDLPLNMPYQYPAKNLFEVMKLDKKSLKGNPRFVLLKEIGIPMNFDTQYCTPINESYLEQALNWAQNRLW